MAANNARGRPPHPDILTPAEWQVLEYVRHGMTNRAIASRRGTSIDATKFHVANILDKLRVRDKQQLKHWKGSRAESAAHHRTMEGNTMDDISLGPIGQVSLSISDVERSVAFFRDSLGMTHLFTFGDLAFFDCDGTRLFLSASDEGKEPGNSVIYFTVDDIAAAHASLTSKAVQFQGAPHLIHTHDDGTEEWMAFFLDPDKNLLALMSQVKSTQPRPFGRAASA